jgi:hypothetical protein
LIKCKWGTKSIPKQAGGKNNEKMRTLPDLRDLTQHAWKAALERAGHVTNRSKQHVHQVVNGVL